MISLSGLVILPFFLGTSVGQMLLPLMFLAT
jgi:hypothetical protein